MLCLEKNANMTEKMLMRQILKAFPVMVFKKQLSDGSRKIMSIVEGIDYIDGKIQFNTLYRFQKTNEYMDDNMKLHIDGFHKKINCISDRLALKLYENDVDETTIKKYARSDWSAATAYEIYERGEVNGTA